MTRQAPLRILVVEDEALVAMDISLTAEDCGHIVVAEASSLAGVQELEDDVAPDLAFVDMQLADGSNGLDVSALIQRRWTETMIVFLTANAKRVPDDFAGAHGIIAKPFSRNGLVSALNYLQQGVRRPPPSLPQPASFMPSPAVASRWMA